MSLHIRAHSDGRFLVPDGPVNLPVNQPLDVEVTPCAAGTTNGIAGAALILERQRRLKASAGMFSGPVLPDDALRRENMYDDRP